MADRLQRLHLWLGLGTFVMFLGTGLYMARAFPEAYAGQDAVRYLFPANHVYILFAALLNLTLGFRQFDSRAGAKLQTAGSVLVAAAVPLLVFAFFVEPPKASPERLLTLFGIVSAVAGTGLHGVSVALQRRAGQRAV